MKANIKSTMNNIFWTRPHRTTFSSGTLFCFFVLANYVKRHTQTGLLCWVFKALWFNTDTIGRKRQGLFFFVNPRGKGIIEVKLFPYQL